MPAVLAGSLDAAEKFRAASGGFGTAIHAVLWAAYHKNIFQKYGLDAEYIAIPSGTTGMQMLLASEVQSLFSGGPHPINANLQGADVAKHGDGILRLPDRQGLELVIEQVARENPRAKGQTPESLRLLEPSVLGEIKRSGFLEKARQ